MRSIIHRREDRTCYLCMILHGDYREHLVLHEHHMIYGNGRRRLSERYGLKVYLCPEHHLYGPEAVHRNNEVRRYLDAEAQKAFEKAYPNLVFKDIFGKNMVENPGGQQECENRGQQPSEGFIPLDVQEDEPW